MVKFTFSNVTGLRQIISIHLIKDQNIIAYQLSQAHFEITAPLSRHRHRHQHRKILIFTIRIYSCFCFFRAQLFGISITLLQILTSLRFPIHASKDVHRCSKIRLFEFLEAPFHQCFKKVTTPRSFGNFSVKHPWWSRFQVVQRSYYEENLLAQATLKENLTQQTLSRKISAVKTCKSGNLQLIRKKIYCKALLTHFQQFSKHLEQTAQKRTFH